MSLADKFGIPQGLLDAAKAALEEANEYQKKVQAHMAKKGIKSMKDMTPDQKKKFFNDLDAMHTAKHEEVEHVEEELKGDMHPGAKKVLKHIKPEHHGTYKPYLKKGTYKGDYKDRAAVLSAAEKAGHVKEEVESVELTQEDLDFIASLNQLDDQAEVVEGQLRNFSPHSDLAGRGRLSGYNKTAAGKKREADRETERLKDKMKFTKSQGGIAGPKGKLPEEFELEEGSGPKEKQHDRYVDRDSEESKEKVKGARERMASDEKAKVGKKLLDKIKLKKEEVDLDEEQLDEIKLKTAVSAYKKMSAGGNDMKNRTGMAGDQSDRLLAKMKKKWGDEKVNKAIKKEDVSLDDFTVEEIEEYMQTEEFAQLDELSKETLGSYVKKRSHDVATQGALTRKHAMDSEAKKKETGGYTTKAVRDLDDKANRAFMKGWKHRQNIGKAVDKIVNKA